MYALDFACVRKFNKITQGELANYLGYKSRMTISLVECREKEAVPTTWVNALSNLIGVNLFDETENKQYWELIPERYKKADPRIARRIEIQRWSI